MIMLSLVGKTNVGKSTFFNAATLSDAEISNRIFTTIKPNEGIGYVTVPCPCKEIGKICNPKNSECIDGTRLVPIKLLDIAGLIPGAHEGKGLGNQFLDDLRQAPILIHVLDVSGTTDSGGNPVKEHNPEEDIKFFEDEIDFWYADIFKREWFQLAKETEITHSDFEKQIMNRFSGLGIKREDIHKVVEMSGVDPTSPTKWTDDDVFRFAKNLRKVSKPIIIAANKSDIPTSEKYIEKLRKKYPNMIICYADGELALKKASQAGLIKYIPGSEKFEIIKDLSEKQKQALDIIKNFLEKYGSTGVQKCLNRAVFDIMKYIVVYPVEDETHWTDKKGNILPDAHLIPEGTTAKELAYIIHTDIGEKFIGAIDARTNRKIGADHVLKNNDVIKILT